MQIESIVSKYRQVILVFASKRRQVSAFITNAGWNSINRSVFIFKFIAYQLC